MTQARSSCPFRGKSGKNQSRAAVPLAITAVHHCSGLRQPPVAAASAAGSKSTAAPLSASVSSQDALYGAVYGGGRGPISPVALLHAWWRSAGGHLEGYQQQDSHEFYLTALSGLVS